MLTIQRNIKNAGKQICRRSQSIEKMKLSCQKMSSVLHRARFFIKYFLCGTYFTMHEDDLFIKFEVL